MELYSQGNAFQCGRFADGDIASGETAPSRIGRLSFIRLAIAQYRCQSTNGTLVKQMTA